MSPTLKRTLIMMFTIMIGVYALMNLRGPNGLAAFMEKRDAIQQLEDQNRALEKLVDAKAKYVDDVIFPLIRKKTGWVRDGEQDFHEPAKPAGTTPKPE
jgi:hypothetical protein